MFFYSCSADFARENPPFALRQVEPRRNDQRLPKRMRMPGRASARFQGDARGTNTRRFRRLEQWIFFQLTTINFYVTTAERYSPTALDNGGFQWSC
jgi:hypothetical protein